MWNKTERIPQWNWTPIRGYLINNENQETLQIGSCIILQNTNTHLNQTEDSTVKVSIVSSGSLQFDEEQGWKWHKSWILPDFKIELKIRSSTGNICHPPNNTYVEIFQVKQISDEEWMNVGMRGVSKSETYQGYAELGKGLRMSQTSYGHQGSRFHLLIGGYVLHQGQKKFFFTLSSPPIFVDSRKSDREFKVQRESFFNELFQPEQLEKVMFKQVCGEKLIEIKDSHQGFYNYITASNLRNKIKHPIYLALKFSQVFHFLYKGKPPSDQKLMLLLEKLQTNLIYRKSGTVSNREEGLYYFVPSFKQLKKNRKLSETLKYISTLMNVIHEDRVPNADLKAFNIISPDQLKRVYLENIVKLQQVLITAKKNLFKMTEKDDQSSKEIYQLEEVSKILKVEDEIVKKKNQLENQIPFLGQQIFSQEQCIRNFYQNQNFMISNPLHYTNVLYQQFPFNSMFTAIQGGDY